MTNKKESTSLAKRRSGTLDTGHLNFTALVAAIRQAHEHCAA